MARILAAILILCMIPATVITAFARGKGVYGDYAENQSIETANGQFIPETIKVDAQLNDTGWPESGFAEVNGNTGYWSTVTQTGNNSKATYKYQIRSDIEQLYVGATLTLPELADGQNTVTFYVFMKDAQNTSSNIGYTDLITFTIDVNNQNATVDIGPGDAKSSVGTKNVLPTEAHQFKYDFSTDASGNTVVVLEMRNMLKPIFERDGDISDVTYFVELDLPTGKADPAFDKLVHPKVAKSDSALFPTFDYWPTNEDGSAGGVPVDTTLGNGKDDLPYEVTVDGKFDEAVWSTLTNYYIHDEEAYGYEQNKAASDYASMNGDTVYGTGVKYNTTYFLSTNTTQNPGYNASYDSNDNVNDSGYDSRIFIRYKYEFRVDGDYLYGAVVAYVPPIKEYNDVDKDLGSVKVTTSPDLCIMFYDNERPNVQNGGVIDDNEVAAANGINKGKGYLPETIMQIRSMYPQYIEGDAKYGQIFTTYANCWASKYAGNTVTNLGWGGAMLDTNDKNQFEASRSTRQSGDIWNFEFKIAIDKIPTDDNGDIVYSMYVADRYSVSASSNDQVKLRSYAASGSVNSGENFSTVYPQYSYDRNVNNKITKAQIEAAKNLKVAEKSGFGDGKLDQALWAAVSGADARVDGRLKNATAINENNSFAYKLSADYEYIYGAVLLNNSWNANSWLKLHINRKKTYEELKAATFIDENNDYNIIETYSVSSVEGAGNTIGEWKNSNLAVDTNRTRLTDGVYQAANWSADHSNGFSAWQRATGSGNVMANVDFTLTELYTTKKIEAWFAGGDDTSDGQWGIKVPIAVKVFYSEDGVNYTEAPSKLTKEKKVVDTTPSAGQDGVANDYLHGYKYTLDLNDYTSARYIRLQVTANGGFIWMSEVDIFVTETHGEYYDANMRLYDGDSIYFYHNSKDISNTIKDGEFEYEYVTYGNGRAVEFKISLNALNIDYDLAADELDELFAYYITVEEKDSSGVMSPRNESGAYTLESTNWLMDKTYDGANVFTYGDMLGDIRVDGKLDEKYWIGKDVEMQHVDATNGTWQTNPTKGNSFSYDYKIYAGNNYLYGAAVIDVSAITADTPYVYENVPITRFDIWLDNGINEYDWVTDNNNKTNINVSNDTSDATDGEIEGDHYNGAREYDFQYYTNYYYNIYLSKTDGSINVVPGAGNDFVCGGTTPQTLNDPDIASDDSKAVYPMNESRWSWGMSTVNGKTYVEFMIKLDDIYCTDKGFNYYVSATHTFGTETSDDTSDDEILTLMYPAIDDLGSNEPLWVTHINSKYHEGAGVIFTYDYTQSDEYKTWCESEVWWGFALLRPVTNGYEIVEISNGLDGKKKPIASDHIKQGDLVYALNHGNDYIYIQHFKDTHSAAEWNDKYGHITDDTLNGHAGKNYINDNVVEMMARFRKWRVGDVLKLTIASDAQQYINNNTFDIFLAQNGFNYDGTAEGSLKALQWYEPAYVSQNYFALMQKGKERTDADALAQITNLPTTGNWDTANAATIKQLKHFAPETINIDGIIQEAGWAADKWIYVYETANGSLEHVTSLEEANNYKQVFKYQLRTDGEFLYLAAEIAQLYNEANSPFVKLWLKSDSDAKTWTHYYDVSYGQSTLTVTAPTPSYELAPTPTNDGEKKNPAFFQGYEGKNGSEYNEAESLLTYNAALGFAANGSNTPAGEANKTLLENSLLYGFTDEIQENQTSGIYDPTIKTTKFYLAKESAVIGNSVDKKATWVEFKVALSEFGGLNGFEYYVEAGYEDYHLFYPVTYVEPESERCYMNNYFPTWEWDSKNCAKVTAEDIAFGAIRMRNNCMPVVSLGAKVTDKFIHPDTGNECKAIRFGVLYNEDYIRNWRKTDALPVDVSDVNHTDMKNDYWDVATVGVAFLPTVLLKEGEELTVSTPTVKTVPADNIVKWKSGSDVGGWSNFADYENFVFFVVVYGVPENIKMSFRPYVDFYASVGTESYYGETFIRSYQMVVDNPYSEEDDGVLVPDYDENNPPFEDFTSRDI